VSIISSELSGLERTDLRKSFGPIEAPERMILLDVLRGFAIFGILVANNLGTGPYLDFSLTSLERFSANLIEILVRDKFWPLFALLFGIGFAVQLERADARNAGIWKPYLRRLLFLALIGGVLQLFIEVPQLLQLAITGVPMLVIGYILRHRPRRVLQWCILAVCLIGLSVSIPRDLRWLNPVTGRQPQLTSEEVTQRIEIWRDRREQNQARATEWNLDRLSPNIRSVLRSYRDIPLDVVLARRLHIFLLFYMLIGMLIWRSKVLHEASQRRRVFLHFLAWSLPIGIAAAVFVNAVQMAGTQASQLGLGKYPSFFSSLIFNPMRIVASLGMALTYVAGITLLMQRIIWARVLIIFSPVGRMALTNYIFQALFPAIIFGSYTPAIVPPASVNYMERIIVLIVIFGIQVVLSQVWLRFYKFGPLEWLLRSLTYWRRQPMRNR